MRLKIIIILAVVAAILPVAAEAREKPLSWRFSLGNEAVTLPTYKFYRGPLHPAVIIGVDVWEKQTTHGHQSFGPEASYYFHKTFEHAVIINGVYRAGWHTRFGLSLNFIAAAGYKHSFLTGPVFKFEEGAYKQVNVAGKSQFNLMLGPGLEFALNDKISITAESRYMLVLPYAPKRGMPFATHAIFSAGIKIKR